MEGIILKGIGGFYTVRSNGGTLIECKPRGILRNRGEKPLPGDRVVVLREADTDYIDEILPRRNALVRPPVANVDVLFIVASTVEPSPSFLVLDRLSAYAIDLEIEPVVVATKTDLASAAEIERAYAHSGISLLEVNAARGQGLEGIRVHLQGRLCVMCGNSGVGKSTLLNALVPGLHREVGGISKKLGRGRHTTREVALFEADGGLLADTPGFASFDLRDAGVILADNMQLCFPEIKARIGQCRFSGCAHMAETGCAVRAAVEAGSISQSRYDSYMTLYREAKQAQERY